MGDYQLRPGQGLMFNTDSRSNIYPDFKGQIKTPSGELLNVAGWWKTTRNVDTDYLSIKITSIDEGNNTTADESTDRQGPEQA